MNPSHPDSFARTKPVVAKVRPMASYPARMPQPVRRRGISCCLVFLLLPLVVVLVYLLAPVRSNFLVLGIDRPPQGTNTSRTDTIILVTVQPLKPYIGMLSIPRDLWVPIAGQGENRINTVHFFAEIEKPGSGPSATAQAVQTLFKAPVTHTLRLQFDGVEAIVDAMGGVTVDLPAALPGSTEAPGLPAGKQHLTGKQALALARDRKGADDFFRMAHGQLLVRSVALELMQPRTWPRLPLVLVTIAQYVDTNMPIWEWPRLGLAFLRLGADGIDSRTLDRSMVKGFITSGGADVLLPQWDKIRPVVDEMFH